MSIAIGTQSEHKRFRLCLIVASYFAMFHCLSMVVGYFGGIGLSTFLQAFAYWVASGLLIIVGIKMLLDSTAGDAPKTPKTLSFYALSMLAIASSIDAMAMGVTIPVINEDLLLSAIILGLFTFLMTCLGFVIGAKIGAMFKHAAERFGGVLLILLALNIVFSNIY